MKKYEGMFLLDTRQFAKGADEALEFVKGLIEKHGGKVIESGKWDERRLAYEINKQRRGLYLLFYYEAPSSAVREIERDCHLSESVLRVLTLAHEGEIPKDAFRPAPPPEAMAARPSQEPAGELIPELAELERGGIDWEEAK